MLNHKAKITLGLLLAAFFSSAVAEKEKAQMLDDNPSYCKIFNVFNGGDVPEECPKKRGSVRKPPQSVAFSKGITFEFDSSNILPESAKVLDTILAMLQHEIMSQKTIRVEGHTDRIGTAEYNQRLSEQRALAVKRYFVQNGVQSGRIQTVGFGFNKLYDPDHPEDGINRRVEFANLGE